MVYENDVNLLKPGQKIDITVANRPGEELSATIFAIGKEFDPNLRAVHIHARLDNNPGDLIPGMYVSGHIHAEENYVRTLPNDAVVTEGTKSYIFILDKSVTRDEKEDAGKELADIPKSETNSHTLGFKMVEVLAGMQEGNYTEINLLDSLPENANVVMNAAYYLLADIKKNETEHEH
jgi:cobalt-zinc-cadmium efflux system membrane fusion protein